MRGATAITPLHAQATMPHTLLESLFPDGVTRREGMTPHTAVVILVIDDAPSVGRGLARLLRLEGYRVETACNGRQALAQLSTQRYDVILTDLHMPEVDGRTFYARVR
jgi:PleD family two-component response regulator